VILDISIFHFSTAPTPPSARDVLRDDLPTARLGSTEKTADLTGSSTSVWAKSPLSREERKKRGNETPRPLWPIGSVVAAVYSSSFVI
jgi:hypothetical protein